MEDEYLAELFAAELKVKGRNASSFSNGVTRTPLSTVKLPPHRMRSHFRDVPAVHASFG